MSTIKSVLSYSCTHFPLQDDEAIDWIKSQIEVFKPDILVHQGDAFEAKAVSRFKPKNGKAYYTWPLKDEFIEVHNHFEDMYTLATSVNPKCEVHHIEGNHGYNIRSWDRTGTDIAGLMDYREYINEAADVHFPRLYRKIKWHPYLRDEQHFVRVGPFCIGHGFLTNKTADRDMALEWADPFGLYVGGHTHAPTPVTQAQWVRPVEKWYCNVGTVRDIWRVDYMEQNNRQQWGQAVFKGTTSVPRYPNMLWKGKAWDAEVEVYRMFSHKPAVMHQEAVA